uniref:uncharacterized protein LOC117161787 n=1 Tax=Bombus vancouverensis nearcticus TaxID=2705178 RepID=UPI00143989CB|nr:uncharacterized protein LOC117161787 [Bombus vancouverensis nearcticus]
MSKQMLLLPNNNVAAIESEIVSQHDETAHDMEIGAARKRDRNDRKQMGVQSETFAGRKYKVQSTITRSSTNVTAAARTHPCGTPALIPLTSEYVSLIFTMKVLLLSSLTEEIDDDSTTKNTTQSTYTTKLPPIFVEAQLIDPLIDQLNNIVGKENYTIKQTKLEQVKIQSNTPENYRKVVKELKEKYAIYHTSISNYQPQQSITDNEATLKAQNEPKAINRNIDSQGSRSYAEVAQDIRQATPTNNQNQSNNTEDDTEIKEMLKQSIKGTEILRKMVPHARPDDGDSNAEPLPPASPPREGASSSDSECDSSSDSDSDSTSEVGFEHTLSARERKSIVRALRRSLGKKKKKKGHRATWVSLSRFNPEAADADPAAWYTAVGLLMRDHPLKNSALYSALNRALEGPAAYWLTQILNGDELTLPDFKEQFAAHFGGQEVAAASLIKVAEELPRDGETSGAYGNRIITLLGSKCRNSTREEVLAATALHLLALRDERFKRLALTSDITSVKQFQREMKPFLYAEWPTSPPWRSSASSGNKREGEVGTEEGPPTPGGKPTGCTTKSVVLSLPQAGTHRVSLSIGARRKTSPRGRAPGRCLRGGSPTGRLSQQGESFPFYFDSGAICLLIKESAASKYSGRRTTHVVVLRGIRNTCTGSTSQILSTVCINGLTLDITFHVLADSNLKYDIMIGREILSQGFDVNITRDSVDIYRSKVINVCSKVAEVAVDINEVDTDVIGNDKARLISILESFKESFITGFPRTRVSTGQLEIRLIDPNVTVQRSPYRHSEQERRIVRERIDELIRAKIVRPSNSPFASPMVLVKKKDGTDRLCVDFRALNKNTVADRYPLPLIADQIARLQNARYFITLDMASGFHQIPIHPDSTEYTAFVTPDGQYEYLTMSFGLKNAPAVFQRAILKALGDLAHSYAVVYLNDVLIIADSIDQALERLHIVLNTLVDAGFSFNFAKCSFLKMSALYLGYVGRNGEVRPNPRKIQALNSLPAPLTVTQLRQFIGLASYFRTFIPKFSQVMKPQYALTSSSKYIAWTDRHEKIRQKVISVRRKRLIWPRSPTTGY